MFTDYDQLILHYGALAEEEKVELLCIVVELERTAIWRKEDWRRLIDQIRQRCSVPRAYAANWRGEYEHLEF